MIIYTYNLILRVQASIYENYVGEAFTDARSIFYSGYLGLESSVNFEGAKTHDRRIYNNYALESSVKSGGSKPLFSVVK